MMTPAADEFAFHATVVLEQSPPSPSPAPDTHPDGPNCNATCHLCGACREHVYQCDQCGKVAEERNYALDFSRDPHGHTCYGGCPASDEGPERILCGCGSRHVSGISHLSGEGDYTERKECDSCSVQEEDIRTCPCRSCDNWLCPECGWEGEELYSYYTCVDCNERYADEDAAAECNVWRCDLCESTYCDEDGATNCSLVH